MKPRTVLQDDSKSLPLSDFGCTSSILCLGYVLPTAGSAGRGSAPKCTVKCSIMGRHMVAYGCPPDDGAVSGESVLTLTLDVTRFVQRGSSSDLGGSLEKQNFTNLQSLWATVKDRLALPLFASMCRAAGLPPPLGLITLPVELKEAILHKLPARALAALMCSCAEFRHTAASGEPPLSVALAQ